MEQQELRGYFESEDQTRLLYRQQINEHFGHLETDVLIDAMKMVRDANLSGQVTTVRQLHERLADNMLVVGGSNPIALDQLSTLMFGYWHDQRVWDAVISSREIQGDTNGQN